MNIFHLSIITSLTLLAGCAGMNSQFEFEKPAKDSGYWMSEADSMTQNATSSSQTNKPSNRLNLATYRLIHLANIHPEIIFLPPTDFAESVILTPKTAPRLTPPRQIISQP